MLEVLVVEPDIVFREALIWSFQDFKKTFKDAEAMNPQFPPTPDEALALLRGGYCPTDFVVDTDAVLFSSYAEMAALTGLVRIYAVGKIDNLQFHKHAKILKRPYQFIPNDKMTAVPYAVALDKNHC